MARGSDGDDESFRKGLEEKFRAIQSLAIGHMKTDFETSEDQYHSAVGIIQTYRASRETFENRVKEVGLLEGIAIPQHTSYEWPETRREIRMVISNASAAVAFLTKAGEEVPKEVRNKLDALLGQIAEVENLSPNLHAHLAEAVKEHEAAHYLSSSVLAAKSIDYVLSKLPGDNEVSKADSLVVKGLLKKELKDGWILTWKRARNYYVHDLSAVPASAESLSLVTAACELGLVYTKANLS